MRGLLRACLISAVLACGARQAAALDVLRLPWIFSDKPQLTADFNFYPASVRPNPGSGSKTRVELALGGHFSRFGLPRGAARAPELAVRCEFISPGELISRVAIVETKVNLDDILVESGLHFERRHFSSSSRLVFKTEFSVSVPPGDYNVVVSIEDRELSVSSRRTLHVIVPDMDFSKPALSDLKFCLAVGQELDSHGKLRRVLDPNPWRQVGGSSGWDLIVAYDQLGPALGARRMRRISIRKLRGAGPEPLWQELSEAAPKKPGEVYLVKVKPELIRSLGRGIYVLKVELWPGGNPRRVLEASKTFEILQP